MEEDPVPFEIYETLFTMRLSPSTGATFLNHEPYLWIVDDTTICMKIAVMILTPFEKEWTPSSRNKTSTSARNNDDDDDDDEDEWEENTEK